MIENTQQSLPWSASQDEQLRALIRGNYTIGEIALRMGRLPHLVYRRAHEIGALRPHEPRAH